MNEYYYAFGDFSTTTTGDFSTTTTDVTYYITYDSRLAMFRHDTVANFRIHKKPIFL